MLVIYSKEFEAQRICMNAFPAVAVHTTPCNWRPLETGGGQVIFPTQSVVWVVVSFLPL